MNFLFISASEAAVNSFQVLSDFGSDIVVNLVSDVISDEVSGSFDVLVFPSDAVDMLWSRSRPYVYHISAAEPEASCSPAAPPAGPEASLQLHFTSRNSSQQSCWTLQLQ